MTLISSQTLSSSAASVTFSSLPQTYKTLKLMISGRCDSPSGTNGDIQVAFNGTAATSTRRLIYGDGSSVGSGSASDGYAGRVNPGTFTSNTFGNTEIIISNYAGSTSKTYAIDSVDENNATTAFQVLIAGLWASTSAITSVTFAPLGGSGFNFVSGSSFTLYGLS